MSAEDDLKEALELALLHRDSLNYFTNGHPTAMGAMSAALADRGYVVITKKEYSGLKYDQQILDEYDEWYWGG